MKFLLVLSLVVMGLLVMTPPIVGQGYPDLGQIVSQMQAVAAAYPSICQFVDVTATYGTSPTWEGRHIHALKISDNVGMEEDETSFFVAATHHGNEIVNPVIVHHTWV